MKDDVISRQAALDALEREKVHCTAFRDGYAPKDVFEKYNAGLTDGIKALKGLPSVDSNAHNTLEALEQRWIPCSERLPDYNIPVLTWDSATFQVEKRIPCVIDDDGEPIFSEWWISDEYDEEESLYYPNLRDGAAIAWMPLPEPPKEEEM